MDEQHDASATLPTRRGCGKAAEAMAESFTTAIEAGMSITDALRTAGYAESTISHGRIPLGVKRSSAWARLVGQLERRQAGPEKVADVLADAMDAETIVATNSGDMQKIADHRVRLLAADRVAKILRADQPEGGQGGPAPDTFEAMLLKVKMSKGQASSRAVVDLDEDA